MLVAVVVTMKTVLISAALTGCSKVIVLQILVEETGETGPGMQLDCRMTAEPMADTAAGKELVARKSIKHKLILYNINIVIIIVQVHKK